MRLKRLSKGTLSLFLVVTLLVVSSLLIAANTRGKEEIEKLSRGFYSANLVKVNLFEINRHGEIKELLKTEMSGGKDGICFKTDLMTGKDIRGICYSGAIEKPAISSGRFFSEAECFSDKKIAVAGSGFADEYIVEGEKKYIEIADEKFEVVGVLGTKQESRYDLMLFIPMETAINIFGEEGTYVFDGNEKEEIFGTVQNFVTGAGRYAEYVEQSNSEEAEYTGVNDLTQTKKNTLQDMYLLMFISYLLAAVSAANFWIRYRYKEIQVYRIVGAGTFSIIRDMLIKFIRIWSLSYIMGVGITFFIRMQFIAYPIQMEDYFTTALISFVPGSVTVLTHLLRHH